MYMYIATCTCVEGRSDQSPLLVCVTVRVPYRAYLLGTHFRLRTKYAARDFVRVQNAKIMSSLFNEAEKINIFRREAPCVRTIDLRCYRHNHTVLQEPDRCSCALHKTVFPLFGSEPSWVSNVGLSFEPFAASDRHACSISRGYFSRGGHASNAIEFAFRITRPTFCRLLTTYVAHGIALHWWSMSSQWYRIPILCVCVCVFRMAYSVQSTHIQMGQRGQRIWLA